MGYVCVGGGACDCGVCVCVFIICFVEIFVRGVIFQENKPIIYARLEKVSVIL